MPWAKHSGLRIYWEEEGDGHPLLMVLGLGLSLEIWGALRRHLARSFRLILFDNRCVGQSASPWHPFRLSQMAGDALAVLDAARVDVAHVFGLSMGGMIAQELALRHPERVGKLVLGCTYCAGPESVLADFQVLWTLASPLHTRAGKLKALLRFLYHPNTPQETIAAEAEIMLRGGPGHFGYLQQLSAIAFWDSWNRLPEITAPTLVMHGEADRLIPPINAEVLARRIPGAKLVLLRDAAHIFPTDQPEQTREELLRFLAP